METNWCTFETDSSGMCAVLSLKPPIGDNTVSLSATVIDEFLKNQGVTFGIDSDAIEGLATAPVYNTPVTVARGKDVINGANGYFEFLIPVEDYKDKPVINKDGSVDYYNSLRLAQVDEGTLFAKYIHATKGSSGCTVYSKVVTPVPGKEIPPLKGTGFITNADHTEYYASYSGHIMLKDNSIVIEKVYYVNGDLDIDKGNIVFDGDVEIKGDVRSGMSVISGGSVFIHGHIGACKITARNSVTIKNGIQGRNKCIIEAGDNIICRFVERCTLKAGNSIFADSILDSDVTACNLIKVISKSGTIIGGHIIGMAGIIAKEAGNNMEAATYLQTGPLREDIDAANSYNESINRINDDISTINRQLVKYGSIKDPSQKEKADRLREKLFKARTFLLTDKHNLSVKLKEVSDRIDNARNNPSVYISGISHAGIRICIENNYYNVTDTFKDVIYKLSAGEIIAMGSDENNITD